MVAHSVGGLIGRYYIHALMPALASLVNVGITFMAASDVSATLLDDKGAVVGKNLTKSPEANATFRSIVVDKPVGAGTWKLRLENTAAQSREAVIAAWQNTSKPGAPGNLVAQR